MNVYTFHVYRSASERDASAVTVEVLEDDTLALEHACKLLRHAHEAVAVEVWTPSDMLFRVGEAPHPEPSYLGRWDRLTYR